MSRLNRRKNLVEDQLVGDGFQNFTAKLGIQTENLSSLSTYTFGNIISRNHVTLESIYRSSWIAGQVVDTIAEDMTREGISMVSTLSPDNVNKLQSVMSELAIWQKICSTIKWSRLYGGAIAVILTEGADYSQPLEIEKIGKNKFKGLVVFDRWQLEPSFNELITELVPEIGQPKYYTILPAMETMPALKVHYSRVLRFDGIEMPYYQKKWDNLWGMSVIERMYDRLLAFDSATQGASQLIYKAHLRVVQIEGLRQALAMGGKTEQAVIKQFQYIRLMQTNEGITLLDKNDSFSPHSYTFSGLAEMLMQFGQQISGATGIPLVRLFGQSPSGFNSGDADLRNYYDHVKKLQETNMRMSINKLLEVMSMSTFGEPLPDDFEFDFISLWNISENEKSTISTATATAVSQAFQAGLITKKIAMRELAESSHLTGIFTNITDEDIENAEEEPPEHQDMGGELGGQEPTGENINLEELEQQLSQLSPKEESAENKSIEDLEQELKALSEPEQDDDIPEEKTLEDLDLEVKSLDYPTLEKLELELKKLDYPTLAKLEEELKKIGNPSLEDLEMELEKLKAPTKDKSMFGRVWDGVKKAFVGE